MTFRAKFYVCVMYLRQRDKSLLGPGLGHPFSIGVIQEPAWKAAFAPEPPWKADPPQPPLRVEPPWKADPPQPPLRVEAQRATMEPRDAAFYSELDHVAAKAAKNWPEWISSAHGGSVPLKRKHDFHEHTLNEGARIDFFRGVQSDDLLNEQWEAIYLRMPLYTSTLTQEPKTTTSRGDAMEQLVGVAWRASQYETQPQRRMTGCVPIDVANSDVGYLDFSRSGTCDWLENMLKWIDVWNHLRKLGLTPKHLQAPAAPPSSPGPAQTRPEAPPLQPPPPPLPPPPSAALGASAKTRPPSAPAPQQPPAQKAHTQEHPPMYFINIMINDDCD